MSKPRTDGRSAARLGAKEIKVLTPQKEYTCARCDGLFCACVTVNSTPIYCPHCGAVVWPKWTPPPSAFSTVRCTARSNAGGVLEEVLEEDPGKDCGKCGKPFEVRPRCFFWRGRYFSGRVCGDCNSLWNNPDDSFLAHVKETAKAKTEAPS